MSQNQLETKKVKGHKMFEEFNFSSATLFTGEYDNQHRLIYLYNSLHQSLIHIFGTYQWKLIEINEVYFIEEDIFFKRNILDLNI